MLWLYWAIYVHCVIPGNIQEIEDSPLAVRDLWLQSFASSTWLGFLSHLLKDQGCVSPVFPTNGSPIKEWAKLVGLQPGKSILHR